jgi:hypothetical protein
VTRPVGQISCTILTFVARKNVALARKIARMQKLISRADSSRSDDPARAP